MRPLIVVLVLTVGGLLYLNRPAAREEMAAPVDTASDLPRLLDLGADKCVPCKLMAPILEQLQEDLAGQVTVEFIDVWKYPEAATPYSIKVIPTQIFFTPAGEEVFRHEGFFSREDILAKWAELGFPLQVKNAAVNEPGMK